MRLLSEWFLEPLANYGFMRYGLAVAVIVGVTSGVLSCLLVVRRQALMGDAIAHAVLLGVALGWTAARHVGIFWGALAIGVLAGIAITAVERSSRVQRDAAMGVVFTAAFALGITIISVTRPRGVDLFHILLGNVLGVGPQDLALTAVAGGLVLVTVAVCFRELHAWSFDPVVARAAGMPTTALDYLFTALLSAAIVAALQSVGLVLVVAMLVTPGATALLLVERLVTMMLVAAGLGLVAAAGGLYGSFWLDVPSGPAMVLVASGLFMLALLLAPRRGVLVRAWRSRAARSRVDQEDLLAALFKINDEHARGARVDELAQRTGQREDVAAAGLRQLARQGLARSDGGGWGPTAEGRDEAVRLVRAHRLLETYLHDAEQVPLEELHAEADRLEHEITPDLLDDLDRSLGRPAVDPHGHPIPSATGVLARVGGTALDALAPGTAGTVTMMRDDREELVRRMVEFGLVPGAALRVEAVAPAGVTATVADRRVTVPPEIAARIFVE